MADSLVLTGVKDVKKHTGDEMLLTRPKRGGDSHPIKEWWKGGIAVYATAPSLMCCWWRYCQACA